MIIKGHNDFYDGWLASVFGVMWQPRQSEAWREGFKMGEETHLKSMEVVRAEISKGNLIIKDESFSVLCEAIGGQMNDNNPIREAIAALEHLLEYPYSETCGECDQAHKALANLRKLL